MNLLAKAAAVLLSLASLTAQEASESRLEVTARFEPARAAPGSKAELVLTIAPSPGWHVYGKKDPDGIPPSLQVLDAGGLSPVGAASVPDGTLHRIGSLASYWLAEPFEMRQGLTVPATMAAGSVEVRFQLDYMACNETSCEPPDNVTGSATLEVQGAATGKAQGQDGQRSKPAPGYGDDAKVAVQARLEPSPARPGETVKLILTVDVVDGWHVYGSLEEHSFPTTVELGSSGGLRKHGDAVVPGGEPHLLGPDTSYWLAGTFTIEQQLAVPEAQPLGSVEVGGKLHFMPCDESSCLNPTALDFTAPLLIEAGAPRTTATATPAPAKPDGGASSLSLWQLVLECVLGGLLALAMPCTYPMIPITFSFFTKQAEARHGNVLGLALTYGIGIVLMFVVIGLAFGQVIIPFAGHWATNAVLAAAFFLFALSLFGVFTLQLPAFVQDAAGRAAGGGGLLGVFFMGATLVVSSFTCTAPVVALLLARAAQGGDSFGVALGMAVFGLTMALPFVVLSLLPGRVKRLPRSGEWMNTLKYTLGYVELVAALKFFSNVDVYFDWGILPREVFLGVAAALFLLTALTLWGILPRTTTRVGALRRAAGLAFAALAAWFTYGATGQQLDYVSTAMAPPYELTHVKEHVVVYDEPARARELAEAQGKLVLHDFTGFFCSNCRAMELDVFRRPAVAKVLRDHFVESRQHVDVQKQLSDEQFQTNKKMQADLVGTETMPFYVIVDPKTGQRLRGTALSGPPHTWERLILDFLTGAQ